jgi:hypothetical protein
VSARRPCPGFQPQRVKFMIRDRGSNYTTAFDVVLAGAGIRTVLCNVQMPRMNAIAERWIGGCRRELLDRTLIWNQDHLRQILRQYETHHNQHRPHRSLDAAGPAETATSTGRSRPVPRTKADSRQRHDSRISPGRVARMRFSALTGARAMSRSFLPGHGPRSSEITQLSRSMDRQDQPNRSVHAFWCLRCAQGLFRHDSRIGPGSWRAQPASARSS